MALARQKPSTNLKTLKVLVLEDDLDMCLMIEHVLRSIEPLISLDWATTAEGAILELASALTESHEPPYDLIVADVFLDGKSTGIDFWRTCQEFSPDTPILVTSSLSLDRFFSIVGRDCISPPYLQKPFTPLECRQRFESLIGSELRFSRPHLLDG